MSSELWVTEDCKVEKWDIKICIFRKSTPGDWKSALRMFDAYSGDCYFLGLKKKSTSSSEECYILVFIKYFKNLSIKRLMC